MLFRNKKIINLFLSLVLVLGIVLAPMQNMSFAEEADVVNLTIVHTNDVHSRVVGDDTLIGFGKLGTFVKQLEEVNPNILVLDAGDITHGTPLINISRGEAMIRLMNEIGYDAMTPGNHDFNYGYDRLVELSELAEFPILAANVVPVEGEMDLVDYMIKEIGELKIGIFGLATEETVYKSHPKNTEGVNITDPIAKAKEVVGKLQAEEVDMIIALSHLGLDEGSNPKSSDIAEQVEGVDLIVDGHSHSLLSEGQKVGDTLIVQTGEHLKNIGVVNIAFTDGEITAIESKLVTRAEVEELTDDEGISAIITELQATEKELLSEVIGKTNVKLVGEREIVRTSESNLGNLMTDALLKLTEADVALTNGGGIRASIEVGDITRGNIFDVFPFGNYGVKIEVTGADILAALEHGVAGYPGAEGKFPHVAGMTFKIDPNSEAGNRVYDVMIQGEPLDLERTYTLATNDFTAAGGDEYNMFIGKEIVAEYGAFDEILAEYVKELGEVNIDVEGRIVAEARVAEEPVVEEPVVEEPVIEEPVQEPTEEVYVVKPGDVLWKIAEKFGLEWEGLAEFNSLENPHLIFPDQEILIPAQ